LSKIAPLVSEKWSKMTEAEKKPYYDLVEEDRKRHDRELQSLLTKGFFINKKGQNSTELKVRTPRKKAVDLPQKRIASSEDLKASKKLRKE
jgi:hypothetical protein